MSVILEKAGSFEIWIWRFWKARITALLGIVNLELAHLQVMCGVT